MTTLLTYLGTMALVLALGPLVPDIQLSPWLIIAIFLAMVLLKKD
jgi:hypothetical protein